MSVKVAFAWGRFTRKVLQKEKLRSLHAQARLRRLARLYLIKSNNERLFVQTRLANLIHRYIKQTRAKRKVAANMRWRKFAMMLLEREKPFQMRTTANGPEARWLELVTAILERPNG